MTDIGAKGVKSPVALTQYRSDGDTIPWIASGGEAIGDVVVRNSSDNRIGIVSSLTPDMPATATAADEISVRVSGLFWGPKTTAAALNDGVHAMWNASLQAFEARADGPHEVVGQHASGDANVLVRINVLAQGTTITVTPSASPSASPSSSAS